MNKDGNSLSNFFRNYGFFNNENKNNISNTNTRTESDNKEFIILGNKSTTAQNCFTKVMLREVEKLEFPTIHDLSL